jgi:hypothetical protein
VVQAEAQTKQLSCNGGDALIEGNHNTIVLTGDCRSLLLKGVANTVSISLQAAAQVRVEGSGNRITFQAAGAAPVVQFAGPDNSADPGAMPPSSASAAPPAPLADKPQPSAPKPAEASHAAVEPTSAPTAPTPVSTEPPKPKPTASGVLTLTGDDQQRDEDCTGRPVVIEGNRSAYVLRGGCESLTVHGDLDTVQAELRPGAAVGITGHGTTVSWALLARGKGPAAAIHGEGNRVQRIDTIGGLPVP